MPTANMNRNVSTGSAGRMVEVEAGVPVILSASSKTALNLFLTGDLYSGRRCESAYITGLRSEICLSDPFGGLCRFCRQPMNKHRRQSRPAEELDRGHQ